jgi:predicted nucleic acid-binding protein
MPRVLFDTSIYIKILRRGDAAPVGRAMAGGASLWLSAVVLEELYAGASRRDLQTIERLERDFDSAGRVAIPTLADWSNAGKTLALLAKKYDYERIGRGRLTNDALIATSAARLGIAVITANARDFGRLAECRPFQWRLQASQS